MIENRIGVFIFPSISSSLRISRISAYYVLHHFSFDFFWKKANQQVSLIDSSCSQYTTNFLSLKHFIEVHTNLRQRNFLNIFIVTFVI